VTRTFASLALSRVMGDHYRVMPHMITVARSKKHGTTLAAVGKRRDEKGEATWSPFMFSDAETRTVDGIRSNFIHLIQTNGHLDRKGIMNLQWCFHEVYLERDGGGGRSVMVEVRVCVAHALDVLERFGAWEGS